MQTITFISRKPTPSRVALGNVMDNHAETLRFKLSRRQGELDLAGAIPALHLQGKGILALESALEGDWVVVDCPVTALFTGRALRHTASLRFTLPDGQAWGSDDFELEVNARTDESQPVEQQTDWNLVDATLLAAREAEVAARIAREVKNGKSAYELALEDGYTGTKEQWFQSLRGGEGKSAYEVALEEGFEGTPQQWLGTLGGLAEVARLESKLGRSFDTSGEVSYTHELSPQPGGYAYTTSTFSGWGCAIGRPTQLNRLTFRIKARTSSPSPTSKVRMVLRMGDKDGSILAEYTDEQLSVAPGAYLDYQWCFDKVKNTAGSMFYFNYYTDQPCDCFKVELPELPAGQLYPAPTYAQNNTMTAVDILSGGSGANNRVGFWTKAEVAEELYRPSDLYMDTSRAYYGGYFIEGSSGSFSDMFRLEDILKDTEVTPGVSGAGWDYTSSVFSGWGGAIGSARDFNTLTFRLRNRSSNTGAITKIRVIVRKTDFTGTTLADRTILDYSIAPGTDQTVRFPLGATIANPNGDKLWAFFLTDQKIDV